MLNKEIEKKVIEKLENFKPEDYWSYLWDNRLVGSQGPWTLDYLRQNRSITAEAQKFAQDHFENDSSDVDDMLRHNFYIEVLHYWADEALKAAKEGNEDYDYLIEIEDEEERFDVAMATEAEDMNYHALCNLLAHLYDEVTFEEVGLEEFLKLKYN